MGTKYKKEVRSMDEMIEQAKGLIRKFKGQAYAFGKGVLDQVGPMTAQVGTRGLLVSRLTSSWLVPALNQVLSSLKPAKPQRPFRLSEI
jgi:hypothetical protein